MAHNFGTLLADASLSDVVCVVGDGRNGKEFAAHKAILASRSPFFDAIFTEQNSEMAKHGRVHIADIKVATFEKLLQYIYTGTVANLEHLAFDLFAAADKVPRNCKQAKHTCLIFPPVPNRLTQSPMQAVAQHQSEHRFSDGHTDLVGRARRPTAEGQVLRLHRGPF
jgi:hypothetical protein